MSLQRNLIFMTADMTANMTEENHLGYLLQEKPEAVQKYMDRLFSMENLYANNPITSGLAGSVGEEVITSTEWEYRVKGQDTRPMMVTAKVFSGSIVKSGTPFKIILEKDIYVYGDVLKPLETNEDNQFRVIEGPTPHGTEGYAYILEPVGEGVKMSASLLDVGKYWTKLYSKYGEGADRRGSTSFGGTLAFRGRMSLIGKQYRIDDLASLRVLTVGIPDRNGKIHGTWVSYAEAEYWAQWYQERENLTWLSTESDTNIDNTGRPVRSGPGIEQQIKQSGNVQYVNQYDYRLFEEYLQNLFFNRVAPGDVKNVKGFTGHFGLLQFNKIGKDMMEKSGFVLNAENVVLKKISSKYNKNAYEVGFQITRLNLGNNTTLELFHLPLYDDVSLFTAKDPITGKPAKSLEITFLDFKGGNEKNVIIKKLKNGFAFNYVNGLYSPTGPTKPGMAAHSGAWYEMNVQEYLGVQITDVTKTGKIAPNTWLI